MRGRLANTGVTVYPLGGQGRTVDVNNILKPLALETTWRSAASANRLVAACSRLQSLASRNRPSTIVFLLA